MSLKLYEIYRINLLIGIYSAGFGVKRLSLLKYLKGTGNYVFLLSIVIVRVF